MLAISRALRQHLVSAMEEGLDLAEPPDPQLTAASRPEFGDFQANGAMGLARQLQQAPRQIAQTIVDHLDLADLCEPPRIAGPGFINLTLKPEVIARAIAERVGDPRLGVATAPVRQRVVVDFSSPNIAKEMHVGHLRSTIIGDCLARLLAFRGHDVLRLNHVGDWGTQFGMLITQLKQVAPQALDAADAVDLGDLVAFYRQAKQRFDEDETFRIQSREEVVKLQRGDPFSRRAWALLCSQSRQEFQRIYDRLGVGIEERGESFYNARLTGVVEALDSAGLLVTDDGARCMFPDGSSDKRKQGSALPPVIVQKRDGGFNYATTDLAAIRYRLGGADGGEGDAAERVIYVTDAGQASHFEAVFQVARRAGWITPGQSLEHVPFGLVQGADGRKLKTRAGDTVRLRDLLDQAVQRARADLERRLADEGRQEDEAFIAHVAETVGMAAVKYADLSQNRITDYQFSFDRMLALQGNTAPYLLYAYVRIQGIARRGGALTATAPDPIRLGAAEAFSLARQLLHFDEVLVELERELLPNRLCTYLFELSQTFNRFYDRVPVLKAEEPDRSSRLALCRLSADTLKLGLELLGIGTLDRM